MSKSPSWYLVKLQGKLQLKNKGCLHVRKFLLCASLLQYISSSDCSGWFRLKCNSRKTFDIVSIKCVFFFTFCFGRGAARQNPRIGGANAIAQHEPVDGLYHRSFTISALVRALRSDHAFLTLFRRERSPGGHWIGRSWVTTPRRCGRGVENSTSLLGIQPQLTVSSVVA